MDKHRVVVTGMGVVSPVGIGLDAYWEGLKKGVNGISRVDRFDPAPFRTQMAAQIDDFEPEKWIDKKMVGRLDRFIQFALAASEMAVQDAGLDFSTCDKNRIGVFVGSGIGGIGTIEENHILMLEKGPKAISPFFLTKVLINMAPSMISIQYGLGGPMSATSMACSTGAHMIGDAFRVLQRGDADVMLAGSTESSITPLSFAGFCASRSMSQRNDEPEKASRPFDKNRDGFVMGEGGGIVILETLEHAKKRKAKIYAEIAGFGSTADGFHFTAPHPEGDGMIRVMKNAMKDAGIQPESVGYINAHGTSTPLNDKAETLAIQKVFGEHAGKLKISSIKSMIGHLLGGAGSLEFISTVKTVETGICPPTINYAEPDPECPLDYVTQGAETKDIYTAITNNFGFGGGNACLAVIQYKN